MLTYRLTWVLLGSLFLAACGGDDSNDSNNGADGYTPAVDWCDAALGLRAGQREALLDFSNAHTGFRLFGPQADWLGADDSLEVVLQNHTNFEDAFLEEYAGAVGDMCVVLPTDLTPVYASVEMRGTTAIVTPGTDLPVLPPETTHVVVDLRNLSATADVGAAASTALQADLVIAERVMRKFNGFPSQDDGWTHYDVEELREQVVIRGANTEELPLFFWTGSKLTPEAATTVGGLKLAGRAVVIGHDIFSAVAESTFTGVSTAGLMWRSSTLFADGEAWPDSMRADRQTATHEDTLDDLNAFFPTPATLSDSTRTEFATYRKDLGEPAPTLDKATMKAALVVLYGTLDWFYPYFDLVGRDLDTQIVSAWSALGSLGESDRDGMMRIVGAVMNSIDDGHGFYSDWGSSTFPDGYLGVQIQNVAGEPVVRMSIQEGVNAGDTIVEVGGVPAAEWYAEAMGRYSASSDGYRFVQATNELKEVFGTKTLKLRAPDGSLRDETLESMGWDLDSQVPWGGSFRANGFMDDMGAADIFYLNLNGNVTTDLNFPWDTVNALDDSVDLILDMRDYPTFDIYEYARNFHTDSFTAPIFGHPTWRGPERFGIVDEVWAFEAGENVFQGDVVLMVSNKSVSAAECFSQMIEYLPNVTVVGQPSAATNGTITNAWLPGQIQMTFTGMRLLNPDRSEFHGIGVVPDIEVVPTAEQFAAGIDPELSEAVDFLQE
jgi:hypothetical protein